jgi:catechol 2,3-dioxygenase-like lactoylglutathione lyase family enzyme
VACYRRRMGIRQRTPFPGITKPTMRYCSGMSSSAALPRGMTIGACVYVLCVTAAFAWPAGKDNSPASGPALMNVCLVTNDVPRLVDFYGRVLQIRPNMSGPEYAEFPTGVGVLAIFSAEAQEKYIPHAAQPASNQTAILEFKVADVDKEYARLKGIVKTWVKPPTTQPWGTRSTYFRDPDGNLINFFMAALEKKPAK